MTNIYLRFGKIWKCWPQKVAGHTPLRTQPFHLWKRIIYILHLSWTFPKVIGFLHILMKNSTRNELFHTYMPLLLLPGTRADCSVSFDFKVIGCNPSRTLRRAGNCLLSTPPIPDTNKSNTETELQKKFTCELTSTCLLCYITHSSIIKPHSST